MSGNRNGTGNTMGESTRARLAGLIHSVKAGMDGGGAGPAGGAQYVGGYAGGAGGTWGKAATGRQIGGQDVAAMIPAQRYRTALYKLQITTATAGHESVSAKQCCVQTLALQDMQATRSYTYVPFGQMLLALEASAHSCVIEMQ